MLRKLKFPVTFTAPAPLLGLVLLVLGFGSPGSARADLRFRALPDGSTYLAPLEVDPPGLPAGWRYVLPGAGLDANSYGPPKVTISYDPLTGLVRESYLEADVDVLDPLVTSHTDYAYLLSSRTLRRSWRSKTQATRSVTKAAGARTGGLFRVELPVQLPKVVRSIVGDGAPNLEVSGSETITLAGKSDWTANRQYSGERQSQGIFPSFEMKQELNVNLTGSIGDKIKVDVDQSSNVQTSLDNKVKLRYEGDEDDMIKSVELGNTNLSLQGAGFRQEGLFGVKTVAKMGNFDVVTIASRQEGKNETARFTPSGDRTRVVIPDVDYVRRQYYFVSDSAVNIATGTLKVWRDVGLRQTGASQDPGVARLDPTLPPDTLGAMTNPQVAGNWISLRPDEYSVRDDYFTDDEGNSRKIPVIRLVSPLGDGEMLAVSYVDSRPGGPVAVGNIDPAAVDPVLGKEAGKLLLKMIKPPTDKLTTIGDDFDPSGPWYPTLAYELRNFYNLGAQNISLTNISLVVRKLDNSQTTNPDEVGGQPLIQILGLDQVGDQGEKPGDGRIDLRYIIPEQGVLFFPDLNPFDPAGVLMGGCTIGRNGFLCLNDTLRNTLRRDDAEKTANPLVYYRARTDRNTDTRYYIEAELQSSRAGYYLGKFNILEGSEQVRVDGVRREKNIDYTIDYITGQITFMGQNLPGPESVITVDFSSAQGLGQAQKTLLGFSTTYSPSADMSFSTSLLRESKGALEELVKLGEEPASSMVGDFSTILAFKPVWMTELANRIPGIRTSAASGLNLDGNVSTSLPNPNSKGEAYVDDMEGNRESNTVSLTRSQWLWSSVPIDTTTGAIRDSTVANHALLEWYNPLTVIERDLKPTLVENEEGAENVRQVLEMNIKPPTGQVSVGPEDWTGITVPISTTGADLTRTQYIEVWINDFQSDHTATPGRLHINFGRVSEDAYWDRNNPPNGQQDTEDKNGDGRLDRPDTDSPTYPEEFEDTGLDRLVDEQEPGFNEISNPDPNGDNYRYDIDVDKNDYSTINNTEDNGLVDPVNARPDTEDLDRDGRYDPDNNYFEVTIDLSDTHFVALDVPLVYSDPKYNLRAGNGWRLYRIPIDSFSTRVGNPSWNSVQAVRLWIDDMNQPMKLQVGGIEMIGSRWLRQAITDPAMAARVTFDVLSRNNKDDAGIGYIPPYEVENQVGGTAARREQSLAISYKDLADGDSVFAFKTFGDVGNPLGWTQYREMRFYIHGDPGVEAQNIRAVARFGPDSTNYYEYSVPLRSGWQSVVIPMQRLSDLKARPDTGRVTVDSLTALATREIYTAVGNPSFTRISRIAFGLTVDGTPTTATIGEMWIDELRLADVRKDRGFSSNVSLQAYFADLLSINASLARQDEDYFRVGSGLAQGSGLNHTALGFSSTLHLDRFMPTSGIDLPVRVSLQHSSDVPKFRTNSDVILDEARSNVEVRESNLRSLDFSYRRTGSRKGIGKYTLDAISGNLAYTEQSNRNPFSSDSSWLFTTSTTYSIPIGGNGIALGPIRVNPIPRTFQITSNWTSSRNVGYARTLNDTTDFQELRSDVKIRQLNNTLITAFEPLSAIRLSYTLNSNRDMLLHQAGPLGNKGTEIFHRQMVELNYKPRWLNVVAPTGLRFTGTYVEDAARRLRSATDPEGMKDISNVGAFSTTLTLPISRFGGRRSSARDTSGSFSPLAPLRFFLSKVQDVSASFNFDRSTGLTRVVGDPGMAFKSGFTQVVDPDIRFGSTSVFQTSRRFTSRANTGFRPIQDLSFDLRGDHALSLSDQAYYGERRTLQILWPEITARWSSLQRTIRMVPTFSSLTLSSGYRIRSEESGPVDGPVELRTRTRSFDPILGWEATFRSGVRTMVRSSLTKTETSDDRSTGYVRDVHSRTTTIQVNKTFPASKGIKFPWAKNRTRLPNDLNLGFNVDLGGDKSLLNQPGVPRITERDNARMDIRSSTNYNFSQSITGGFNLWYRQATEKKTDVTTRGMTIEFTGSFRF